MQIALSNSLSGRFDRSPDGKEQSPRFRRVLQKQAAALLALMLLGINGTLSAAELKPPPTGIYDLLNDPEHTGDVDLDTNPVLDNPNVDGYRLRISWASVQPNNASEYNWAAVDTAIAIAAAHGKKMCISVAAGLWTPDWVYSNAPVVYKYAMKEIDPDTGLPLGNQPLPWDTSFQTKWKNVPSRVWREIRFESSSFLRRTGRIHGAP